MPTYDTYLDNGTYIGLIVDDVILSYTKIKVNIFFEFFQFFILMLSFKLVAKDFFNRS